MANPCPPCQNEAPLLRRGYLMMDHGQQHQTIALKNLTFLGFLINKVDNTTTRFHKVKMILKMIKQLAVEITRTGGHTEKGFGLLIMFILDVTTLGILALEHKIPVSNERQNKMQGAKKMKGKKKSLGLAVSYDVANFARRFFAKFPVYVLKEEKLINEIVKDKIFSDSCKVNFVGLDCEWVNTENGAEGNSGTNSPVALLQIATPNECFLFQVCHLKTSFPSLLKSLLEDKHILKFGVGIDEDCRRLRMFGIQVCGTVDLRYLIQRCHHKSDVIKFPDRIYGLSLMSLSDAIVGVQMDKSFRVRCSNWESNKLTDRQISYATNDALVALQIFLALCIQKVVSKELVALPCCLQKFKQRPTKDQLLLISFLSRKSLVFDQTRLTAEYHNIWNDFTRYTCIDNEITKVGFSLCQGIIDLSFKNKSNIYCKKASSDTNLSKLSARSVPTRKTPLYHNCLLIAPDGCLLCTCDRKKAEWYVNRGLGTMINSEPFTVQLNFDPSGRPFVDRDYYRTLKENKCVVCGKEDDYVKKMIVPRDYRRHFPSSLKDHLSHDVLLLCVSCHQTSELHDLRLKQEIAETYSIPIRNNKTIEDAKLKRVRSAAKALVHGGDRIPEERRETLKNVVKEFLQEDSIDIDTLKTLSDIGTKKENELFIGTHGERVVSKLVENGTLREFVKMWREHFLNSMKPQFLPEFWSVDHNLTFQKKHE